MPTLNKQQHNNTALHYHLTFREQQHIIEELVRLGCRLQQRHQHCGLAQVHKVTNAAYDLEGVAAVQAGADLQGRAVPCKHRSRTSCEECNTNYLCQKA